MEPPSCLRCSRDTFHSVFDKNHVYFNAECRTCDTQTHLEPNDNHSSITVFYNRYDIFFNTSNNFPKLLTHQHTYNTQLTKQLISCLKSHILN